MGAAAPPAMVNVRPTYFAPRDRIPEMGRLFESP